MTTVATQAALTGLRAAQRALDTISSNIANASTEGYTRKILPQETLMVAGTGIGVKTNALVRIVDKSLLRDLMKQTSISSQSSIEQEFLNRIQDFHGASNEERSISAKIGNLGDAFSQLSSAPDNNILLSHTLSQAQDVVDSFNDFSKLLKQMRTDAEGEISADITSVNQALKKIADLNVKIANLTDANQSAADLEDQRDVALKTVSKYLQISTYFADGNQLVVMTKQGQTLSDSSARTLVFNDSNPTPTSYYPGGGLSGVFIDSPTGIEITPENMGGELGGLMKMRDDNIPTYQAQIDELAQKMAERFDQQGLRLFTDVDSTVPSSVAPPAAVPYVGFASRIRLNADVVADPSLLRKGTYGAAILPGSNEIIRKISEFAFGAWKSEDATGTANISAGTIFGSTTMTMVNQQIGNMDLTDYVPDLDAAANITAPADFQLTIGGVPQLITINPGDTAADLVNTINTTFGGSVASINGLGQLRFDTTSDITIADSTIGAAGMADLGFSFGTQVATAPSFSVQVGTQSPVTISIGPADTAATVLAQLNAIAGLDASLGPGGVLYLVPEKGGDLTLKNVTGSPLDALGMTIGNVAHNSFRQTFLGPNADLDTGIVGNASIEQFAQNVISAQAEDASLTKDTQGKDESFLNTLTQRNQDQSGVNIDEEISNLIRVQTAYTAAARMVSAVEKTFDDLFAAFQ